MNQKGGNGTMPTQAKKEGNARHIAKLDIIKIQPYKEEGTAIRAAASAAGMSVQKYILEAVREKIAHERAGVVHDELPAGGDGMAAVSPAKEEKPSPSNPSKLSPDDWAAWARRQDGESLEDWKARLKKSNIGTSTIDIMKRIGKLPQHDRNLILEIDSV